MIMSLYYQKNDFSWKGSSKITVYASNTNEQRR